MSIFWQRDIIVSKSIFLWSVTKINVVLSGGSSSNFNKAFPDSPCPVHNNSELKIKESNDYWEDSKSIDYVLLPFQSSLNLMKTDTHSNYITEDNDFFIITFVN